ncbi:Sec-independent protein translocase protein TatB [Limnobacter alexandrii]|jgi:sec-independent protein translocase protein TatB|uniref:Sec-independent protein translocase protein TatB n=1 Tax=Limnobacter alexandrii TaxID=2570352 RepID=UPI001109E097|nr:Sec-independent protein translocase protein TatB [Limnobacter alexandrii]
MFDIAFSEMLIIAVIALLVIGPEKLPKVAKTVGHLLGKAQRYVSDVKSEINREMEIDELRKLQAEMQTAARKVEGDVQTTLRDTEADLNKSVKSIEDDIAELESSKPATTPAAASTTQSSPKAEDPAPEQTVGPSPKVEAK